ncbi:MAG: LCP family protein [Lachnospiraceae bacterium]|nr:LCP family protein [Lachnospiraceae bacterium]
METFSSGFHDKLMQVEMLFQSPILSIGYKEYSIENFVDKRYFSSWKGRENCADTDAMRQGLFIDDILSKTELSKKEVLTYLQYTLNISELCRRCYNEDRIRNVEFNTKNYTELMTRIRGMLRELNFDVRYVPEKEIVYLVSKNITADAAAESTGMEEIAEYNSFSASGDLKKKRGILKSMGELIGKYPDNLSPSNYKLYGNIEFMLHNLGIKEGMSREELQVPYVAGLSDEELEKWYDEAYQMMLFRILQHDNQSRMERVNDFQNACEGKSVSNLKAKQADKTSEASAEEPAAATLPSIEEILPEADPPKDFGEDRKQKDNYAVFPEWEAPKEKLPPKEAFAKPVPKAAADPVPKPAEDKEEVKKEAEKEEPKKEKIRDRGPKAPGFRDVSDSASSVVIHIEEPEEEKEPEIKMPEDLEELLEVDDYDYDSLDLSGEEEKEEEEEKAFRYERKSVSNKDDGKKKKKKGFGRGLFSLFLLLLIFLCVLFLYIHSFYHVTEYVSDHLVSDNPNSGLVEVLTADTTLTSEEGESLTSEAEGAALVSKTLPENVGAVTNLLFAVVDQQDESVYGNVEMLAAASLNRNTGKTTLISLDPSLFAIIPGKGAGSLSDACVYGGCPLLSLAVEKTYRMDVSHYVCVGMSDFLKMIDEIGGLDLTVTKEEAIQANIEIKAMAAEREEEPEPYYLTHSGENMMNGYQTVALVKTGFINSADLLELLAGRIANGKTSTLLRKVLACVSHNIPEGDILANLFNIYRAVHYQVRKTEIPFENAYREKGGVLMPDMEYTLERLTELLGGGNTDEPSYPAEDESLAEPAITPKPPWLLGGDPVVEENDSKSDAE